MTDAVAISCGKFNPFFFSHRNKYSAPAQSSHTTVDQQMQSVASSSLTSTVRSTNPCAPSGGGGGTGNSINITTPPHQQSTARSSTTDDSIRAFAKMVIEDCFVYLDAIRDPSSSPAAFKDPQELYNALQRAAFSIEEDGCSTAELRGCVETILRETVHTGHQRCVNQLFHRADMVSVVGDWITATINASIYTYESGPIVTLMEQEIVAKYQSLLGWATDSASGTLPPGGSLANLYGIACARTNRFPHVPNYGWNAEDRPVMFVSEQGHYSSKKSCGLLGIGYEHCIAVATDAFGRMIPEALKTAIHDAVAGGFQPFCVVATAGTTLTGAADPLSAICDVVDDFNKSHAAMTTSSTNDGANTSTPMTTLLPQKKIWVHVDGALGGSLIHSSKHAHSAPGSALRGVHRVQSITINPHKMLGATLQCSLFLTQHEAVQRATFCTNAAYLFNDDKQYDALKYDVGDKVFRCGRRPDCLKLWLMWKHRGDQGMSCYVDRAIARHARFNEILRCQEPFKSSFVVMIPDLNPIPCTCFWWVPSTASKTKGRAGYPSSTECHHEHHQPPPTTSSSQSQFLSSSASDDDDSGHNQHKPSVIPTVVMENAAIIDKVVPRAKFELMTSQQAIVTISKMDNGVPNFWRMVMNGAVAWDDEEIVSFLNTILKACDTVYDRLQSTVLK